MTILVLIIHVIVCLCLISIVLLQSGKGAELGAAFGGSSQTIFGSRGAATFLNKMTTVAAIVFMITSLTLAVISTKGGSVIKKSPLSEERKTTPTPLGPGPMQGSGLQPGQPLAPAQQQGGLQPGQTPAPAQQQRQQAPVPPSKK